MEKCADPNCNRSVKKIGQKYCSDLCAEISDRETNLKSARTVRYSTQAHGDQSKVSYARLYPTAREMKGKGRSGLSGSESDTGQTLRRPEREIAWNGVGDTSSTRSEKMLEENQLITSKTQLAPYGGFPDPLSVETLDSKNLIDDSVRQLHELMKSVATPRGDRLPDAQMINAACNCASSINNLLKLKLEVYKAMKKNSSV